VKGASRTLRRYPGGAVVSVRLRDRTYAQVVDDMIDGVLATNRVGTESVPRLRRAFQLALGETEIDLTSERSPERVRSAEDEATRSTEEQAPPSLAPQARVAERQTQAA
jgi:hypothetical protein